MPSSDRYSASQAKTAGWAERLLMLEVVTMARLGVFVGDMGRTQRRDGRSVQFADPVVRNRQADAGPAVEVEVEVMASVAAKAAPS